MKNANERYATMSHGVWAIDVGSEYWLTVAAANALWERFRNGGVDGITVEESAGSLLGDDYFSSDGLAPMFRKSQRIDVVAWNHRQPIAVIEIKRGGNNADDVARVACLVSNKPTISFGIVGFAIHTANETQYRIAYNNHIDFLSQIAKASGVRHCAHDEVSASAQRWVSNTKTQTRWLGFGYCAVQR